MIELERAQPSGSPQHPVDAAALRAKLLDCVAFSGLPIGAARVDALIAAVQTLESAADVRVLIGGLA